MCDDTQNKEIVEGGIRTLSPEEKDRFVKEAMEFVANELKERLEHKIGENLTLKFVMTVEYTTPANDITVGTPIEPSDAITKSYDKR